MSRGDRRCGLCSDRGIDVAQAKASHAVDEEKVKGLITRSLGWCEEVFI